MVAKPAIRDSNSVIKYEDLIEGLSIPINKIEK
jgi:hypothetical protein